MQMGFYHLEKKHHIKNFLNGLNHEKNLNY